MEIDSRMSSIKSYQGAPDGMKEAGMMGTSADACINLNRISSLHGLRQKARNEDADSPAQ
jgi:hypothetical protein